MELSSIAAVKNHHSSELKSSILNFVFFELFYRPATPRDDDLSLLVPEELFNTDKSKSTKLFHRLLSEGDDSIPRGSKAVP